MLAHCPLPVSSHSVLVLPHERVYCSQFEGISSFAAGLRRISTFTDRMEYYSGGAAANVTFQTSKPPPPDTPPPGLLVGKVLPTQRRILNEEVANPSEGQVLSVSDLSIVTPDGSRNLVVNLSVGVQPGEHLLVMGNSGTGKSSLMRALSGLWDRGSGEIQRLRGEETMFLPQRPYCTLGSLRQQLVYPQTEAEWATRGDDEALVKALRDVQLLRLAAQGKDGLDVVRDWGDELSLGEQQRLAMARVLINRPKLVILDEATSALDLANEAVMYGALAAIPDITYISVGHRPSLLSFHSKLLRLLGDEPPFFEVEAIDLETQEELRTFGSGTKR